MVLACDFRILKESISSYQAIFRDAKKIMEEWASIPLINVFIIDHKFVTFTCM